MKYEILISESARKQLNYLQEWERQRIQSNLKGLETYPRRRRARADIKKLHDVNPELYRLRVGSFRIIYAIVGDEVRVTEIMRRGRDYRGY
ncbi:MAG: type II toxin-antitoxin system RelE/ParE family toxin [Methanosarcinales archaeon]|uniref:Type II toxin-antitoxin system RelE/ParE family toxin n=1 Tax=Candidatus Ethanoperedens thermophilum TaxID=2766897 RepID=A0A848D720_9EURY|nr:type II toxin-antitoxin system RelE/ParE family toxin [Candidatus Ethanoperedens thermophilum]